MRLPELLHRLIRLQPLWRTLFCISIASITWLGFTSEPYPIPSATSDKINHMMAFMELAILTRLGWPLLGLPVPLLVLTGFGLALELGQSITPWRDFAMTDLLADVVGILLGYGLMTAFYRLWNRHPQG
ncbi:VanZ family protein [Marinobacter sp. M1N3S26]|uniref:VanZ family protein n=1 Tax=Marinobacter sp. M1N3S26 TaxID=3382299 RepID=UPI00387B93E8